MFGKTPWRVLKFGRFDPLIGLYGNAGERFFPMIESLAAGRG